MQRSIGLRPPQAAPGGGGDEDVLEHRHAAERARHLVGLGDAEPAALRPRRRRSRRRRGTAPFRPMPASPPARTFNSVVLPAPLGPTMPTASSAPTVKSTLSRTDQRAEPLADTGRRRGWRRSLRVHGHSTQVVRTQLAPTGTFLSSAFSVMT